VSVFDTPSLPPQHFLPGDTTNPGLSLRRQLDDLSGLLDQLQQVAVPDAMPKIAQIKDAICKFHVKVSLVGQVKAGKTALTNGLINMPDLLPSDVNPWTSVITSVHVNTQKPGNHKAVFTFFNKSEWADMVNIGGRLGEAAQRANFKDEFATVQDQIRNMQTNAEQRLGRNFKYLLGSAHHFTSFNPDLIKRYVCLGDEDAVQAPEGRFADLTRSADIYLDDDTYPLPTTIRDTPGVNDPFLTRESVTLANLSDTDICIIVLSAHQAFTTVDIALLRILLALRHDQIVLFINRIDELEDPDRQIDEIDSYVRDALVDQGLPEDLPIIFGSALWARSTWDGVPDAEIARSDRSMDRLMAARLQKASAHSGPPPAPGSALSNALKTYDLAGIAELQSLIEAKSAQAVGLPFVTSLRRAIAEICQQSSLLLRRALGDAAPLAQGPDLVLLSDQLDALLTQMDRQLQQAKAECGETLLFKLSDAYRTFIQTETRQITHLFDAAGSSGGWRPDTETLRRSLNSAYHEFDAMAQDRISQIYLASAQAISGIYDALLGPDMRIFAVTPPAVRAAPTPTILMQSMTIDITTSWLERWMTRDAGKVAFVQRFEKIVTADMHKVIDEMQGTCLATLFQKARQDQHDFISDHKASLLGLARTDDPQGNRGLDAEIRKKLDQINAINADLRIAT